MNEGNKKIETQKDKKNTGNLTMNYEERRIKQKRSGGKMNVRSWKI